MESAEKCYFCGNSDRDARIVPWLVQTERRSIHMACFLAAYGTDSDVESASAPDEQRAA
jgi:hypothetical protein